MTTSENPLRAQLAELFAEHNTALSRELCDRLENVIKEGYSLGRIDEARLRPAEPGDVVQLDPGPDSPWGPVFAVVDEVRAWGIICHCYIPQNRGEPPAVAPMRVEVGKYVRIGVCEWRVLTGLERAGA